MNKEDFVSLECAKLLKEKGYDEKVTSYYDKGGWADTSNKEKNFNAQPYCYSRPTLYESQKWLRQVYNLHIEIGMYDSGANSANGNKWRYWNFTLYCTNLSLPQKEGFENYYTYESALNAGIIEALKLI